MPERTESAPSVTDGGTGNAERLTGEAVDWYGRDGASRADPPDDRFPSDGRETPRESPRSTRPVQAGQPSDREWGLVVGLVGLALVLLAGAVAFSIAVGGVLGLLPLWAARGLTVGLAALGAVGLGRGWWVARDR